MRHSITHRPVPRRGSVIVIVIWTLAIAAMTATAVQLLAYRQASVGRLAVARTQARWAARAGLENMISVMANHTENPVPDDRMALQIDLENTSYGELLDAQYTIQHTYEGETWNGPADVHAKLNVNSNTNILPQLDLILRDMTPDIVDAIQDWTDDDDDAGMLGVERDYYLALNPPYQPRNRPIRSLAELELVAGIWPQLLRGEDWNLNGRLDPNEDDGASTLPLDQPDGLLDSGWSQYLTPYSTAGGATVSGLPRIYLRAAEPEDLVDRIGVDVEQAASLIYYGRDESNSLEKLVNVEISRVDDSGAVTNTVINPDAAPLEPDQIQALMEEVSMTDPWIRMPGRMNINTVSPTLLRNLLTEMGVDEFIVDEILFMRERPEGITSLLDLEEIGDLDDQTRNTLNGLFSTTSNIYTVSSRGRNDASGVEIEIIAIVDRSTLPVRIIEYREQ